MTRSEAILKIVGGAQIEYVNQKINYCYLHCTTVENYPTGVIVFTFNDNSTILLDSYGIR